MRSCAIAPMVTGSGPASIFVMFFSFWTNTLLFLYLFLFLGGGGRHRFNQKSPLVTTKANVFVTTANYITSQNFAMMCLKFHSYRHPPAYCDPHGYNNVYVGYATFAVHECPKVTHHSHVTYPIGDLVKKLRGNYSNNIEPCQRHGKTHESCSGIIGIVFKIEWRCTKDGDTDPTGPSGWVMASCNKKAHENVSAMAIYMYHDAKKAHGMDIAHP